MRRLGVGPYRKDIVGGDGKIWLKGQPLPTIFSICFVFFYFSFGAKRFVLLVGRHFHLYSLGVLTFLQMGEPDRFEWGSFRKVLVASIRQLKSRGLYESARWYGNSAFLFSIWDDGYIDGLTPFKGLLSF